MEKINMSSSKRRDFLKKMSLTLGAMAFSPVTFSSPGAYKKMFFDISLAQWSLRSKINEGKLDNLDFPWYAKRKFGINAVEYVNQFFFDKAKDMSYLGELKKRAKDFGVKNVLIMIDNEGLLGDSDKNKRKQAVENHYKWIEAAKFLGCHSIRVNAGGQGSREELMGAVVGSLRTLSEFGAGFKINVLVENHGGFSSDGAWLAETIRRVEMKNCGTLPDFGNFTVDRTKGIEYDRYQGVKELMPYAKGVSAKCMKFVDGKETTIDFERMLRIVKDAKYRGHIGIEYSGDRLFEDEGIMACKNLLLNIGSKL
jgi:sugar phosphate isomerase/epimerase